MKRHVKLALVLALAGCGGGAEWELRTGALTHNSEERTIGFIAPDRAAAGEPFSVEITTWGLRGCSEPVRVERERLAKGLRMIPIDRHNVSDICQLMPQPNHHTVEVTFEERDTHVLELRGLEELGAEPRELLTLYHDVKIE